MFGLELCNASSPNASANSGKGTSVTGGHNAYGSWVQLVASTAIDACLMCVRIWPTSNSSFRTFTSIGVGSGGNEVAIASDLYASSSTAGSNYTEYWFPCSIPAGSRISAQCCQSATTDANNVTVILYDGTFEGFSGVDSIGVTIGSSIATDIDPGSSANTKGAWTQVIASTPRDYCGLMVLPGQNSTNNFAYTNPGGIDIAIGGSGSEQIIIPDMGMVAAGLATNANSATPLIMTPVPAGTRIAARAQQGNTTSGTRVVGLALYGVYQ
jgi:hypothetical protein